MVERSCGRCVYFVLISEGWGRCRYNEADLMARMDLSESEMNAKYRVLLPSVQFSACYPCYMTETDIVLRENEAVRKENEAIRNSSSLGSVEDVALEIKRTDLEIKRADLEIRKLRMEEVKAHIRKVNAEASIVEIRARRNNEELKVVYGARTGMDDLIK